MASGDSLNLTDGSLSFEAGVDSSKPTTIQTTQTPNGIGRNGLVWAMNATMRGGTIRPRDGWVRVGRVHDGSAWYQGGALYESASGEWHLITSIGGVIYKVSPDWNWAPINLSALYTDPTHNLYNPSYPRKAYFAQGEQFLVIQAGDGATKPIFYDGTWIWRSLGITNPAVPSPAPNVNTIPAAYAMCYYCNRLWYANGRTVSAGDILYADSGTNIAPTYYHGRDSILNVTESPLCFGGDGFTVPTEAGNIRALSYAVNFGSPTGQSALLIFTDREIYSLQVPITRSAWTGYDAATGATQVQMDVMQIANSSVSDSCVVPVNGDLFYQTSEPGIRSLSLSLRYFNQWANTKISANMRRVLERNDRSLLYAASGVLFNNRLFQTSLPFLTPQGVCHSALSVMDFEIISSWRSENTPAWEGVFTGLNILQVFGGNMAGRERMFALAVSESDGGIDLWEMVEGNRFDYNDTRITWQFETPSFNFNNILETKRLTSAEIWCARLFGKTRFKVEWRTDNEACWRMWYEWDECTPRNYREAGEVQIPYGSDYGESYRRMVLPRPPTGGCLPATEQPADIGKQFQLRITITGFCEIRGVFVKAVPFPEKSFQNIVCDKASPLDDSQYVVSLVPSPVDGGTVSGGGIGFAGDVVTVAAQTAPTYSRSLGDFGVDLELCIDMSGSMSDVVSLLTSMLSQVEALLLAGGIGSGTVPNKYAITAFADWGHGPHNDEAYSVLDFSNFAAFSAALAGLVYTDGSEEDGYDAIALSATTHAWRSSSSNVTKIVLLMTDEGRNFMDDPPPPAAKTGVLDHYIYDTPTHDFAGQRAGIKAYLKGLGAKLIVTTKNDILDGSGNHSLGVLSNGTTYAADGSGGFTNGTGGHVVSIGDYPGGGEYPYDQYDSLALDTEINGQVWCIADFRSDPTTAASFESGMIDAIVDGIQTAIVREFVWDGWFENGALVSSDLNYTFSLSSNRTLTATWHLKT